MIKTTSLEIFKQNVYFPTDIGMVSNNAYLSIVVTNKCQKKCVYCINSETDHRLNLPIETAVDNIKKLVDKYAVKEAILLGGEPTLHPRLFRLLASLRTQTGLEMIRLTTNGIMLLKSYEFILALVDPKHGIQGLNISFHNDDFITLTDLEKIVLVVKSINPNIKIRINTNIWRNNHDSLDTLLPFLDSLSFVDEIRISNLIPKDSFSVNSFNNGFIGLSIQEYDSFFRQICHFFSQQLTLIENEKTLGFVRYVLIPTRVPIIINWNTYSDVSKQVCENDIKNREINTFKCLVNGKISLSWNESHVIY